VTDVATRRTNEEVVAAYLSTGSVWRAGRLLGIAGQTVHERLRAIGHPLGSSAWTPDEIDEMRELVAAGVTAGEIARRLGRSFAGVTSKMSELGIRVVRRPRIAPKRGAGYDKVSMERHLRALTSNDRLKPTPYARSVGLDIEMFVQAMQRHFPDQWTAYVAGRTDLPSRACPYCHVEFHPANARQTYCSRKCGTDARTDASYFGGRRRETIGLSEGVCQLCGREGHRGLSSHHVLGKENDPDNAVLIALCSGCHKLVTLLGSRRFLKDEAAWQTLIALAWMRRHGTELDGGAELYVEVILEVEDASLTLTDLT
jgi:5-methylcytosine-specific restriction endonuclease McrA